MKKPALVCVALFLIAATVFVVLHRYESTTTSGTVEANQQTNATLPKTTPVYPTAISIGECDELFVGKTYQFHVAYDPVSTTERGISWSSSAPEIITVSGSGLATAIAEGGATITATAGNGVCAMTVITAKNYVPVTSIELSQSSLSLTPDKTATLTASIAPANATDQTLIWSSSDPSVATVRNGVVTAIKEGVATIEAITLDGVSASCNITVSNISITLKNELPIEISDRGYGGSACRVTDLRFEAKYLSYSDSYSVSIYFTGEKVFDTRGNHQSASCKIGWKLYDSDGYVVKGGTCRSSSVIVGEKFKDAEAYISDLEPDAYTLVLLDVN